jgi:hypothetical protein
MSSFNLSKQPYIATKDFAWRHTTESAVGAEFEDFRWDTTTDLAGRTLDITFDNGWKIRHTFQSNDTMTWSMLDGAGKGKQETVPVHPVHVRDDIYSVTFRKPEPREDVLLLLNLTRGTALAAVTTFGPDYYESPATGRLEVHTRFLSGSIADARLVKFEPSGILVGRRAIHVYSKHHAYEHIYLSKHTGVWQCLAGREQGETDVFETTVFEFAENLILFRWHERAAPADGILVMDRVAKRTLGRLSSDRGMLVMGANSHFVNPLTYPSPEELGLA